MEQNTLRELKKLHNRIREYLEKASDSSLIKRMNTTQLHIIGYLIRHEKEETCQKDLEIETGLKKASITGALDSLADKGIIRREVAEDDRRKNIVKLTDKFNSFRRDFERIEDEFNKMITKNISNEEKELFIRVINKLQKNVGEVIGETDSEIS